MSSSLILLLRRFFLGLVTLALVAFLIVAFIWFRFQAWLSQPLNIPAGGFQYELASGKSLSHVSKDLSSQQILSNPRWLNWYARYYQKEKIHPGEYFFELGTTPQTLLEKLNRGDIVLHQITFLEGWTFKQILESLSREENLKQLLNGKSDAERLKLLNLPITNLEGWFYPDTYRFSRGTSDVEILTQAYDAMRKMLWELWETRAPDLPYKSDYQALILASIVEKETGSSDERTKIAGVFVRRLQLGMKLQTDPTVIFGMGDLYKGKITRKDLTSPTPYNTYVIPGLPPTPIAIPGKASLHAALHPDASKALYFVAKGDGTSHFSESLSEHQRAVVKYQLQRRDDYRSTPK